MIQAGGCRREPGRADCLQCCRRRTRGYRPTRRIISLALWRRQNLPELQGNSPSSTPRDRPPPLCGERPTYSTGTSVGFAISDLLESSLNPASLPPSTASQLTGNRHQISSGFHKVLDSFPDGRCTRRDRNLPADAWRETGPAAAQPSAPESWQTAFHCPHDEELLSEARKSPRNPRDAHSYGRRTSVAISQQMSSL